MKKTSAQTKIDIMTGILDEFHYDIDMIMSNEPELTIEDVLHDALEIGFDHMLGRY